MERPNASTNPTLHAITLSPLSPQGDEMGMRNPAKSGKIGNSTRLAPHIFRFPAKTATTFALRPLPSQGRHGSLTCGV